MKTKNYIIIGSTLLILVAAASYAATPVTFQDLLRQIGLIQKQVDNLQAQSAPKLGGISAFSSCFLNTAASSTPQLVIAVGGATTTSQSCDTQGRAKNLSLLLTIGSTSTRKVSWEYEWSYNDANWFSGNTSDLQAAGVSERPYGNATTTYSVSGISGTTSIAVSIDKPLARYVRVNFGSQTGTNFWGIISRQEDQN